MEMSLLYETGLKAHDFNFVCTAGFNSNWATQYRDIVDVAAVCVCD